MPANTRPFDTTLCTRSDTTEWNLVKLDSHIFKINDFAKGVHFTIHLSTFQNTSQTIGPLLRKTKSIQNPVAAPTGSTKK